MEARAPIGRRRFTLCVDADEGAKSSASTRIDLDALLKTLLDDVRSLSRVQSPNTVELASATTATSDGGDNVLRRTVDVVVDNNGSVCRLSILDVCFTSRISARATLCVELRCDVQTAAERCVFGLFGDSLPMFF